MCHTAQMWHLCVYIYGFYVLCVINRTNWDVIMLIPCVTWWVMTPIEDTVVGTVVRTGVGWVVSTGVGTVGGVRTGNWSGRTVTIKKSTYKLTYTWWAETINGKEEPVRCYFTGLSISGRRCWGGGGGEGGVVGRRRAKVECFWGQSRRVEIGLLIWRGVHQQIIQSNRMLVMKRKTRQCR